MNKLQELIKKLCPNGVEFKRIEEFTLFEQPTKYIVKSTKYDDNYKTPVLTAGQTFILGYTNEEEGIYNASKENPVIIFDDFTGAYKWVDFPFKVKSSAMKIITTNGDKLLIRFLYHMMGFLNFTSDEHKRLWISIYSQMRIAVPPLEVQCEIVHILDDFTLLSAELSAELKARQKQNEYYRQYLLDIKNGEEMTIGDIYDFKYGTGNTIPTGGGEYPVYGSNGQVGYYKEYNSEDAPVIGHIGAYAGIVNWVSGKHFVTYNGVICKHKNAKVNKKYAYYILLEQDFIGEQKGAQPFVSYDALKKPLVKIPDLKEQERIVSILDRFDKLCNDIKEGLPAEIEARQKQYEYYRDKLLAFKELKINE